DQHRAFSIVHETGAAIAPRLKSSSKCRRLWGKRRRLELQFVILRPVEPDEDGEEVDGVGAHSTVASYT
ncbi:MAG: hypothetical protein V2I26_17870, partial [Halieaceae bacterium]|nr:hypothetical protein [Halieaceae bacterium]